MATVADRSHGDVSIGRVYSRAFGTITSNPAVTLGLAFLFGALPSLGMLLAMPTLANPQLFEGLGALTIVLLSVGGFILSLAIAALTQAVLTRATLAQADGRKASFGESIAASMPVIVPLILLVILMGLGLLVGFMLLFVPGVILYCIWAVASPALVAERTGVTGALGRSRDLTRGHRWKVFGALLLLMVIYWVVSMAAGAAGLAAGAAGEASSANFTAGFLIVNVITSTLLNVVWGTMQASLYVELRDAKDGPDHARLEDVFA